MVKIKQLADKGEDFFPITNTKAVYDDAGNRLDNTINTLNENLTINGNYKFKVGQDGDGNVCYYGADGSLIPFKNNNLEYAGTNTASTTVKISVPDDAHYLIIVLAPYEITQRIMFVIDTLRKKAGRMIWSNDSLTNVSFGWDMDFNFDQNNIAITNIGLDYFIGNAHVYGDIYYKLIKLHD